MTPLPLCVAATFFWLLLFCCSPCCSLRGIRFAAASQAAAAAANAQQQQVLLPLQQQQQQQIFPLLVEQQQRLLPLQQQQFNLLLFQQQQQPHLFLLFQQQPHLFLPLQQLLPRPFQQQQELSLPLQQQQQHLFLPVLLQPQRALPSAVSCCCSTSASTAAGSPVAPVRHRAARTSSAAALAAAPCLRLVSSFSNAFSSLTTLRNKEAFIFFPRLAAAAPSTTGISPSSRPPPPPLSCVSAFFSCLPLIIFHLPPQERMFPYTLHPRHLLCCCYMQGSGISSFSFLGGVSYVPHTNTPRNHLLLNSVGAAAVPALCTCPSRAFLLAAAAANYAGATPTPVSSAIAAPPSSSPLSTAFLSPPLSAAVSLTSLSPSPSSLSSPPSPPPPLSPSPPSLFPFSSQFCLRYCGLTTPLLPSASSPGCSVAGAASVPAASSRLLLRLHGKPHSPFLAACCCSITPAFQHPAFASLRAQHSTSSSPTAAAASPSPLPRSPAAVDAKTPKFRFAAAPSRSAAVTAVRFSSSLPLTRPSLTAAALLSATAAASSPSSPLSSSPAAVPCSHLLHRLRLPSPRAARPAVPSPFSSFLPSFSPSSSITSSVSLLSSSSAPSPRSSLSVFPPLSRFSFPSFLTQAAASPSAAAAEAAAAAAKGETGMASRGSAAASSQSSSATPATATTAGAAALSHEQQYPPLRAMKLESGDGHNGEGLHFFPSLSPLQQQQAGGRVIVGSAGLHSAGGAAASPLAGAAAGSGGHAISPRGGSLSAAPSSTSSISPSSAADPPQDEPAATLIFLHGLGDSAEGWSDMLQLVSTIPRAAAFFRVILPTADVRRISLNGGLPMPAWSDVMGLTRDFPEDEEGFQSSKARIDAIIREEVAAGVSPSRILLGGFSQGGALAYFTALQSSYRLAGIIALSTWVPLTRVLKLSAACTRPIGSSSGYSPITAGGGGSNSVGGGGAGGSKGGGGGSSNIHSSSSSHESSGSRKSSSSGTQKKSEEEEEIPTPVLQCHGEEDELVGFSYGEESAMHVRQLYMQAGVSPAAAEKAVIFKRYPGLGHSANAQELEDVKKFIIQCLALKRGA